MKWSRQRSVAVATKEKATFGNVVIVVIVEVSSIRIRERLNKVVNVRVSAVAEAHIRNFRSGRNQSGLFLQNGFGRSAHDAFESDAKRVFALVSAKIGGFSHVLSVPQKFISVLDPALRQILVGWGTDVLGKQTNQIACVNMKLLRNCFVADLLGVVFVDEIDRAFYVVVVDGADHRFLVER